MKKILLTLLVSGAVSANAVTIQAVGFSGGDGSTDTALNVVLNGIKSAKSTIDVSAYSFTSKPISYALIDASKRGVKVRIVADAKQNNRIYSAVGYTVANGIPTRLNSEYQDFHNKFMIIDSVCVETGSFNYSASAANKNAENALIICDIGLSKAYQQQFNRWFNQGQDVSK